MFSIVQTFPFIVPSPVHTGPIGEIQKIHSHFWRGLFAEIIIKSFSKFKVASKGVASGVGVGDGSGVGVGVDSGDEVGEGEVDELLLDI